MKGAGLYISSKRKKECMRREEIEGCGTQLFIRKGMAMRVGLAADELTRKSIRAVRYTRSCIHEIILVVQGGLLVLWM